uniref:Uncharacterized protein n=1 Tax=Meloidogyne enterolobii TaxID=390850 RepID=A0A6V7WKF8_MELEN|nr:unnamed protein product [Meloidogyne enterolobii]CAD2187494.1 unnamed protein product [Meloidogyne enterolobii]
MQNLLKNNLFVLLQTHIIQKYYSKFIAMIRGRMLRCLRLRKKFNPNFLI